MLNELKQKRTISIPGGFASVNVVVSLLLIGVFAFWVNDTAVARHGDDLQFTVTATNARLNRKVLGDVTSSVQGVPAEPVHSFVWDGDGSEPIRGNARLAINPNTNTGTIQAQWTDEYGRWTFNQTMFSPPEHADGLRVGPSGDETFLDFDDPVPVDVYLHGDTTAGGPVLPTVFNYLATWGPAEITLNGEPFENPYDGPAPLWIAHTMTTVGVRQDDGTVRTVEGDIFNPLETSANGAVDYSDMEFHLVFHDAPGPEMTNNFPPPLSFFYHLTFEDVRLSISHNE